MFVGATVEHSFRIDIARILLQGRPVAEVFTGEIHANLVNVGFLCPLGWNSITHGKILESEIAEILEIAVVNAG